MGPLTFSFIEHHVQVFALAKDVRMQHGDDHNISVMMLTDGEHNELAEPRWWRGPPPLNGEFPLGTWVHVESIGGSGPAWVRNDRNQRTPEQGIAEATPRGVPVTFVGIKDAKTAEIERINHVVEGRLVMVSDLQQVGPHEFIHSLYHRCLEHVFSTELQN